MRRLSIPPRPGRPGFTLVEVLIVVVILGILAATVLPQFTSATEDAKESALKQNLQQLRSQIDLYKFQHNGTVPSGADAASFYKALLCTSKVDGTPGTGADATDGVAGNVGTSVGFPFGPYLLGQLPPNPFNGKSTVFTGTTAPKTGDDGWFYNKNTGEIRADLPDDVKGGADGTTLMNTL